MKDRDLLRNHGEKMHLWDDFFIDRFHKHQQKILIKGKSPGFPTVRESRGTNLMVVVALFAL